jgi:hypothetical protein
MGPSCGPDPSSTHPLAPVLTLLPEVTSCCAGAEGLVALCRRVTAFIQRRTRVATALKDACGRLVSRRKAGGGDTAGPFADAATSGGGSGPGVTPGPGVLAGVAGPSSASNLSGSGGGGRDGGAYAPGEGGGGAVVVRPGAYDRRRVR